MDQSFESSLHSWQCVNLTKWCPTSIRTMANVKSKNKFSQYIFWNFPHLISKKACMMGCTSSSCFPYFATFRWKSISFFLSVVLGGLKWQKSRTSSSPFTSEMHSFKIALEEDTKCLLAILWRSDFNWLPFPVGFFDISYLVN